MRIIHFEASPKIHTNHMIQIISELYCVKGDIKTLIFHSKHTKQTFLLGLDTT